MFFRKKLVKVIIKNKQINIETESGINLYKFLIKEKMINKTLCDGAGLCGKCKLQFFGKNIPKPTYKDKLMLASSNIALGYRLACQVTINNDIEIDTSEIIFSDPHSHITPPKPLQDMKINPITKAKIEPQKADLDEDLHSVSISDFSPTPTPTKSRPDDTNYEGVSDGIFLIQQRTSIRYFCYSAALDNIVLEGKVESADRLIDLVNNNLVPDFIHNVLKVKDIDRVLILTEKSEIESEQLLDMISYHRFDIGTLLCEVIMPQYQNHDVVRFFRLISSDTNNKLVFSLDMLDKAHYLNEYNMTELVTTTLSKPNILSISPRYKNAILSFNDNLTVKTVEKKEVKIDSLSISALLSAVKILKRYGVIDSNFKFKSRKELTSLNIPLDITIRLIETDSLSGFYLYRERFSDLILSQEDLDNLYQLKQHILTTIEWTKVNLGKISGIVFFTNITYDAVVDNMIELGFIPKEFHDKIIYQPGDTTIQAIKLFKERDLTSYIKTRFKHSSIINLSDDPQYLNMTR